jgi:hypothetical protein
MFRGNAKLIQSMFEGQANLMRVALGQGPHRKPRCEKLIHYPSTAPNEWYHIYCPLEKGHKGLHADINHAPFFTDEDADWFNAQYEIWRGEQR